MWIAACDDDANFGKWITEKLNEIVSGDDLITFYRSGMELLEALRKAKHPIDILLLDIEMPGLSGIESAHEFRQICPNTIIVVVTSFIQYALPSYQFKPFEYLIKPLSIDRLKQTIEDGRNIIEGLNGKVMHIETRDSDVFIPYGDLLYIESYCRALYAHTRTKSHKFIKQISQIEKELEQNGFYRIHKSYIINLSHIERIDKSAKIVILSTGVELPVGSRKIGNLASALIDVRRKSHDRL